MRGEQFHVITLSVLLLTSVVAFSPPNAFAGEITYPVGSGVSIVTYRDITDTDPTPPVTFSLNQTDYLAGQTALLSIFDFNANIDVTVPEFITANVTQTSPTTVNGLETGPNTKIFNGTFGITDDITGVSFSECLVDCTTPGNSFIEYDADSSEAARAQITLPLSPGGNVNLSDAPFSESLLVNAGIKPVTTALDVELVDGAAFSSLPTVKISFANANLDDDSINVGDLEMWHKATGQGWEKITDSCFTRLALSLPCTFFDLAGKTITSDPAGAGFISTDGQGQYVLAIDVGLGGGGGGGLVRPGLVFNALAGLGSAGLDGGGGSAYSSPSLQLSNLVKLGIIDVPLEVEQMIYNCDPSISVPAYDLGFFGDFDFPLIINDKGFVLCGYETTIDTQSLQTNTPHTIKFLYYESTKLQHFSLYMNLRDANTAIRQSDTQILYNDGQDIQVIDPNGFFESVSLTLNEIDDIKKQIVIEITFAKEMATTNMIVRSWDDFLNSYDTHILKAFEVVSETIEESSTPTFEAPVIEELESQGIPKWIKNNAAWWSEQQISDSDFISGIEYLIKNGIINVSGVEVGTSSASTEIPDWIQNNAGWWAESLITDGDFVQAMQWLIANGVIQI